MANSISGAMLNELKKKRLGRGEKLEVRECFPLNSFNMAPEIQFSAFSQDRQLRRLLGSFFLVGSVGSRRERLFEGQMKMCSESTKATCRCTRKLLLSKNHTKSPFQPATFVFMLSKSLLISAYTFTFQNSVRISL